MGSLNMIEVLDVINRMSEGGFLRSNMLRSPRQIDIVDRLRAEKPGEWQSKNSLKVIVHRRIKELIDEQLIEEKEKRYHLTHKGKHYLLSNISFMRTNFKHNWGEVNVLPSIHASYGVNKGYLIVDGHREHLIQEKISDFLDELVKIVPEDELDLKLYINIGKGKANPKK